MKLKFQQINFKGEKMRLKVLKVIHGFPPDFSAGSEVYSYNLCKELVRLGNEVHVFTRIETDLLAPYEVKQEEIEGIKIYRVNKPKQYLYSDKFVDSEMEGIFKAYLENLNPDIVHFGHLAHLSINFVNIVKEFGKKVIFTIHDFWLFCVKGQLLNRQNKICNAVSCSVDKHYINSCKECSPYNPSSNEVSHYLNELRKLRESVDLFISPSHTLRDFFIKNGVSEDKVIYQKYGFNKNLITYKKREYSLDSKIRFGFLGRIIPSKGIKILTQAFKNLPNETLRIYGSIGAEKRYMESKNIKFMGSYDNNQIDSILQDIDVLIVPSTWLENSPLVIQEAFLAGIAVITSNIGGMKELLYDKDLNYKDLLNLQMANKNVAGSDIVSQNISQFSGFSFEVNNANDLENLITYIAKNPTILNHINDNRVKVDSITKDAQSIMQHYKKILESKKLKRVTIDTNPDTCNFKCIMCDTHSIYNANFKRCRPDMPLDILQNALNQAKSAGVSEIIPTTMGEPTLYKYFKNIVDFCIANNIKLNLTTNGSQLFSKKYDEKYVIEKLLKALSDIKISFNSLDSRINERIMVKTNTKKILGNIQRLVGLRDIYAKNVSITLQMTFMQSNIDSIMPLIEWGIDKGINRIKGHQLWITHKELESEAIRNDADSTKKWNDLIKSLDKYKNKIRLENFSFIEFYKNKQDSKECPFLGKELWINYNGDINVCCAPDNLRKTLGNFGNIKNITLSKTLESKEYKSLVANYKSMEVCKQCLLRR